MRYLCIYSIYSMYSPVRFSVCYRYNSAALCLKVVKTWSKVTATIFLSFFFFFFQELQSKSKVCANVFCGAGRECAVNEKGEPSCLCIEVSVNVRMRWYVILNILINIINISNGIFNITDHNCNVVFWTTKLILVILNQYFLDKRKSRTN